MFMKLFAMTLVCAAALAAAIAATVGVPLHAQAAPAWSDAFDAVVAHRRAPWDRSEIDDLPLPLVEGPPGIRAPPFSV